MDSSTPDPYNPPRRASTGRRRDPFRVMSRDAMPAPKGPHSRPPRRALSLETTPVMAAATAEDARADGAGVLEEDAPFPGTRVFAVMGPNNERLATVTATTEIVDRDFVAGLERLLSRYRPRPKLRVV